MEKIQKIIDLMRSNMEKMAEVGFQGSEADKIKTENRQLFSQFMAEIDHNSNLTKQCFHPNKSECSKNFIFAHSIQRKKMERIAKNGRIIKFVPFTNKGLVESGISSTSTFKGFCDRHDKIFNDIEQKDYKGTSKQNFLYFYRTLCKYYYDELVSINQAKEFKKLIPDQSFIEDFNNYKDINNEYFTKAKKEADEILVSDKYDNIVTHHIELDGESNILVSTFIWPHTDFGGNFLPDEFRFFTLNIFSENDKTNILISYFKESEEYFSFIQEQLLKAKDKEKIRLLNLLIAYEPRNIAYSPSEFELWSKEDYDEFMNLATDEFHINQNHFKEQINYSFFKVLGDVHE